MDGSLHELVPMRHDDGDEVVVLEAAEAVAEAAAPGWAPLRYDAAATPDRDRTAALVAAAMSMVLVRAPHAL